MKFLWKRIEAESGDRSKGINPGPLGRSGILSTKRVETTTQVLLSLIVKEPRICATEILRNNRTNEAFAKGSPLRWKKPSAKNSKRKPVDRSRRVARRVTKNTARTGFERSWILERDEKHDAETGALGTGSIICHWTWTDGYTDRFSINSKHRRRNNPIFVHNDERIATLAR